MRKNKNILFLTALISFFSFPIIHVTAQTNNAPQQYSFSLKQAVDYAVTNRPAVQNATLDEAIAKQKVNEIRGLGLPQINGSVEFTDYLITPKVILPAAFRVPGAPETISFQQPYNLS